MRTLAKIASFAGAALGRDLHIDFEMIPMSVRRPSPRKLRALFATEINRAFPRPALLGYPSVLQLEPTNACDLRCTLCPSGRGALERKIGLMPPEVFQRLLAEVGPYLSLLILWGWGEPLLHPDIHRMIRSAKAHNVAVVTSTNGQSVTPELADRLVASGLDVLIVALDGATEESYGRYRVGGSQARVVDALDMVYEAKKRHRSPSPLVNLRMVVTKDNESEVPLMREIATRHGADMFTLRGVAMTDLWEDRHDRDYLPETNELSMYRCEEGQRIRPGSFVCRRPWKRATIFWDGTVVPCEMDYTGSNSFGLFPSQGSFMDIVNGPTAAKFRELFLEERLTFGFCSKCPYNDRVTEDCTLERLETRA